MKTSNKLLIAALVVLLSSLATYNMALKAEYKTESYKDPYHNYTALDMQHFEEVDVNAGAMLSVRIEAGDKHEVYLLRHNEEVVQVTQQGNRLSLDVGLTDEHDRVRGWQNPHVIIRTPELKVLRADAMHTLNGKKITSQQRSWSQYYHLITVKGLRQERLLLELDNGSNVKLSGNEIGHLQAVTAKSPESESMLQLTEDNKLQEADLDIRHKGHLVLQNLAIPELRYTFSEHAKADFSGAALAILRK